jgi:hypothetical protein
MAKRYYQHPVGWNCGSEREKALERAREPKRRAAGLARDIRPHDFLAEAPDCHSSHIERLHPGKAHLPA